MSYEVKGEILGFEKIKHIELVEIDELFSTIKDVDHDKISFTVVNPYALREYSFDLSTAFKILLDIKENTKFSVYNVVVIQEPLEESAINFLAPIILNHDNKTAAQIVLKGHKHPDFGMTETIKSFKS